MKKNLVAFSLALLLGAQNVQASDYGLCINRSKGDWRKQVVCNQDETRRLMREINNTYAKLARDPHFNRLNTGKTSLNEQFKSWQEYRNSYCAYWEKAQSGYGDEEYHRAECMRLVTQKHYDDLENLIEMAYAVRE